MIPRFIMQVTAQVCLLSALGCSLPRNPAPEPSPFAENPPRLFMGSPGTLSIKRAQDGDFVRCSADAFADFVCMRTGDLQRIVNYCFSKQYYAPSVGWQEASVR
jgi:hypothetical protein